MFKIILITAISIFLLGTIFCSRNPAPSILGDEVTINYGQFVTFGENRIKIKFDSLLTDSRCPDNPLIDCFWQGMAAIQLELITKDNDTIYIVTSIEGMNPHPEQDSYPAIDTLGLSIALIELYPYPGSVEMIPLSQYRATLKVKPSVDNNGVDGPVLILHVDPVSLLRDDYSIDSAKIENDLLSISVAYSGGCKNHYFYAFVNPAIIKTNPPQIDLYLHHFGNDDLCKAYLHQELTFDLIPLASYFKNTQPDGGDLIIRLNELADAVPHMKEKITYTIE